MTKNHADLSQTSSFFRSVLYMFIASIALLAQTVFADLITPVGVIASGRMSDPENMIDESGMRVSGNRNDYRNWSSLPGKNKTWYETDWFATTHSRGPWTILDLGRGPGVSESAGINRLGIRNERVLQRRVSQSLWPRPVRWRR